MSIGFENAPRPGDALGGAVAMVIKQRALAVGMEVEVEV